MVKNLMIMSRLFSRMMKKKNISAFAAGTAFFLFLSLIPALMLLCAVIPYTPLTEAGLMRVVTDLAPDMLDAMLISMIAEIYDKSIGIVSLTAIVTFWSAGKGILALMRGLNAINDVEEDRNYFVLRIVASFYTVMILIVILISLLIMVFGKLVVQIIADIFPESVYIFEAAMHFRIVVVWAILAVVIGLVYAYVPGRKTCLKRQLPGAVVAAVGWSLITWGFSIYVEDFNGLTAYGKMTTVIILMLWLYFCMYIVLMGALFNHYYKRIFRSFTVKKRIDKMENTY